MSSRSDKYYDESTADFPQTRSMRNSKLYKEVYGKYNESDNLPLEDNADEIDINGLKKLVSTSNNSNSLRRNPDEENNLTIPEYRKKQIEEQKVYDINKILEKAKYENDKLKEPQTSKIDTSFLKTLESTEISVEEIKRASALQDERKYHEKVAKEETLSNNEDLAEEKLTMTRELKYQNLTKENALLNNVMTDSNLSLDLFEDLKPLGDTIITKPIAEETKSTIETETIAPHSDDTSDIDIIKTDNNTNNQNFFTSSYEFSDRDFASDDSMYDNHHSGLFKIVLLFLAIIIVIGVIFYFVGTYGSGI